MENIPEVNQPELIQSEPKEMPPVVDEKPAAPAEKAIHLKINLKTIGIVVAVLVVLVIAYMLKGLVIAATVNGSPISRLSVINELEKVSGKQALDSLITQKLVDAEAVKKGVTVSANEISAEVKKISDQLKSQNQTLAAALAGANMTEADLEKQILSQKKMEKLVADKITVTPEEVAKYITDYKVPVPKGQEVQVNSQIQDQLKQQKLSDASTALISSLRAAASIRYFVSYAK